MKEDAKALEKLFSAHNISANFCADSENLFSKVLTRDHDENAAAYRRSQLGIFALRSRCSW